MTIDQKRSIYADLFSSGALTTCKFNDKIELYTLICYMTQVMKKQNPVKYKNSLDFLHEMFGQNLEKVEGSQKPYIEALSVICDDLLYGVIDFIPCPGEYTNCKDIVLRIKQLVEQWLPF